MQQIQRKDRRILIDAIFSNNYQEVENLLRHGSNVNEFDRNGNFALHHAVHLQNAEIVALLLKYNAEVDVFNNSSERPYNLAIRSNNRAIIKMLLQHKVQVDIDDLSYCLQKFTCDIIWLFYERVHVLRVDKFGYTALHRAVQSNDIQGMKILLSRGANINQATDRDLYTPLHLIQSVKSVKFLLENGADHNLSDLASFTPLCTIVLKKENSRIITITNKEQRGIIDLLIENGANCATVIDYCQRNQNFFRSWESNDGLKYLLKLMALQENKYKYMRMRNLKLHRKKNSMGIFYQQCLNEVKCLQDEKFYKDSNYYSFAVMNVKKLVKYAYNKSIVTSLQSTFALKTKFPIYRKYLKKRLDSTLERSTLLLEASSCLNIAIPCINTNHIASHRILEFLENEDLENLVIAFESTTGFV